MASSDVFEGQIIDELDKYGGEWDLETYDAKGIMNLKMNNIHKGMVALERIFNSDPQAREKLPTNTDGGKYELVNLADSGLEKNVFIGKTFPKHIQDKILAALKLDIAKIAWGSEDLKTFDTSIISHTIPLKPRENPFRQKKHSINSLIKPLI